jgi:hypothetical protein
MEPRKHFKLMAPDGEVIMQGSLAAVMQCVLDSKARKQALDLVARADAAAEQEREREQHEQTMIAEAVYAFADSINRLSRRLDAIEQSRAVRHKLDAVSEATERMLEIPKDAPSDDTPQPTGELHSVRPVDPERHQPAADQGDLPEALVKQAPAGFGTEPTIEGPPKRQVAQPVSISLNGE